MDLPHDTEADTLAIDAVDLVGYPEEYMKPRHKRGGRLWWWFMSLFVPIADADVQELAANLAYMHMIAAADINGLTKRLAELDNLDPKKWNEVDFGDLALIARRAEWCNTTDASAKTQAHKLSMDAWRIRTIVMKQVRRHAMERILQWVIIIGLISLLLFQGIVEGIYKIRGEPTPGLGKVFTLLVGFIANYIVGPVVMTFHKFLVRCGVFAPIDGIDYGD